MGPRREETRGRVDATRAEVCEGTARTARASGVTTGALSQISLAETTARARLVGFGPEHDS